jgi:integrase
MEYVNPIRSKEQISKIKKILMSKNLRDYCLFTLGINTGMDNNKLLNLKIEDVIDENGKAKDKIRTTKRGQSKVFFVSYTAKQSIYEYLDTRNYNFSEPLFPSRKGHCSIQRQQAYHIINKVAKDIGITEKIGTHTLRKIFGYHAYRSGTDVSIIQKLFGHSAPSITLRYIGIEQEEKPFIFPNVNL